MTRSDRFFQVLIGGGLEADQSPIRLVSDVFGRRWPAEDLWQMVPGAENVPPGLAMAEERNVLPWG